MGASTKISWTDHTFNPWIGCSKVSAGCQHCYAEAMMDHQYGKVKWGDAGTRKRTTAANWRKPLEWDAGAQCDGVRRRVFCASLADVFEERPELAEWRFDLWALIERCRYLDWQLLTKRPENIRDMVYNNWLESWPEHVWIGVSVEDQRAVNERVPILLDVPAQLRFLSCEPLLESLDLSAFFGGEYMALGGPESNYNFGIGWVIVGGESGPRRRDCGVEAIFGVVRRCLAASVPVFVKQDCALRPEQQGRIPDDVWALKQFPTEDAA